MIKSAIGGFDYWLYTHIKNEYLRWFLIFLWYLTLIPVMVIIGILPDSVCILIMLLLIILFFIYIKSKITTI